MLGHLTTLISILKLLISLNSNTNSSNPEKRSLSITDDYPEDDPSEYEANSCAHSPGCDLFAGYSGDQLSFLLRIWGSCFGTGTTDLEVMMRNLTHTVNRISRALQELLGLNRDPSLAPIALDNRIALDYLLAAQ